MKRLLLHPAIGPNRLEKLREIAGGLQLLNVADPGAAQQAIGDAEGFFGKITPTLLRAARRLEWVQAPTASLEHYVFPELIAHPCTLTNMRGLFHDVIADHVFGYLLCFARNLHVYLRQQWQSRWLPVGGEAGPQAFTTGPAEEEAADRQHRDLGGATLGIVGLGSIGSEVARRGLAFQMRVLAIDPRPPEEVPAGVTCWPPDRFDDLLAASDYLVIAAPHTPRTEGMFRRDQLRRMKRSAYLVNVGRGALLDLADLTAALEDGEIAGAALDVFEIEPLPPEHPLWRMEQVIITPHIAGRSIRVPQRHLATLRENVRRFAQGESLLNVVDKQQWF